MAPSGADLSSHEMSFLDSPSTTTTTDFTVTGHLLGARNVNLTTNQEVLMTYLIVWLLAFLSVLFIGLRLGAKIYRRAGLAVDDGLLAAAWAAVLFYSVILSLELALGMGTKGDSSSSSQQSSSSSSSLSSSPSSSSSNTNAEALILLDHVARTFCLTAAAWSKSAVAVMLFKVQSRRNTGVIHAVLFGFIALVNTVLAAAVIAHWFRCAPIAMEWDSSVQGSCWSMAVHGAIMIAAQSFSAAMDLALVVLMMCLVWGPSLSIGGKVGALGLLLLGIIAAGASITTAIEISTLTDSNFTTANIRVLVAASIENPIVLIAASLPALKLYNKNHSLPSDSKSGGGGGGGGGAVSSSLRHTFLKHHKNGGSSTSTTIRLIPNAGPVAHTDVVVGGVGAPPSTSHSATTPLRPKASFSSAVSASGGAAPVRPPRPDSPEGGGGGGGVGFYADPTAPAALNGAGAGAGTGAGMRGAALNGGAGRNEGGARGHLLGSPGQGSPPSISSPIYHDSPGAWSNSSPTHPTTAATAAATARANIGGGSPPMISPFNNPPQPYATYHNDFTHNMNDMDHTTDAFDAYEPVELPTLAAPRMLTPLEEEQDFERASSYRSSRISESTMTHSHWLDIPVPQQQQYQQHATSQVLDDEISSQRTSSKFSMSNFLDSYGARAASVLRKMDLIVPVGGAGAGAGRDVEDRYLPEQSQHQQLGPGMSGLNKAGNRDSPTLGDYWGSLPPSPAAATQATTAPTPAPAPATRPPAHRGHHRGGASAGAEIRNLVGGGGSGGRGGPPAAPAGGLRHPWQQHMGDSSLSSYTSYSNNRF